jgi:hypothetical protein
VGGVLLAPFARETAKETLRKELRGVGMQELCAADDGTCVAALNAVGLRVEIVTHAVCMQ